ncbi:hypothetical protein GCM10014715_16740 [Streptomyces spiralis]|uniref:Uncharacterized protein n=1 Tax=Streptomyces spiralis TaxID=66376 RepID=A0A919DNP7_9ACTN|nr:hypothetical protein GCM10014715_16740 [Streptomyces spiralis]
MMRRLRLRGYFCLIRRKVTEFAGKVYVKPSATPVTVEVTGATGVAVSVLTASDAAAGVIASALAATFAPPRSIAVPAAEDWASTAHGEAV